RAAGIDPEGVGERTRAALAAGLRAVVCLGETLEEREAERTDDVILGQLDAALSGLGPDDLARVDLAYEPVWAIGTGRTATPEIAAAAHGVSAREVSSNAASSNSAAARAA
ncbi:MAG: triose-phosphate isomerase, partial [Myxococcales bacterium]|nr:triose-phosphate isomerase [Myxococcales bacterium]